MERRVGSRFGLVSVPGNRRRRDKRIFRLSGIISVGCILGANIGHLDRGQRRSSSCGLCNSIAPAPSCKLGIQLELNPSTSQLLPLRLAGASCRTQSIIAPVPIPRALAPWPLERNFSIIGHRCCPSLDFGFRSSFSFVIRIFPCRFCFNALRASKPGGRRFHRKSKP